MKLKLMLAATLALIPHFANASSLEFEMQLMKLNRPWNDEKEIQQIYRNSVPSVGRFKKGDVLTVLDSQWEEAALRSPLKFAMYGPYEQQYRKECVLDEGGKVKILAISKDGRVLLKYRAVSSYWSFGTECLNGQFFTTTLGNLNRMTSTREELKELDRELDRQLRESDPTVSHEEDSYSAQ